MKNTKVRTSNTTIFVIVALFVVINALTYVIGGTKTELPLPSTYSAHPAGMKAIFDLLAESGFDVQRLKRNYGGIPSGAGALVISQTAYKIKSDEMDDLVRAVENGLTVIVSPSAANGAPADELGMTVVFDFIERRPALENVSACGLLAGIEELGKPGKWRIDLFATGTIPLLSSGGGVYIADMRLGDGRVIVLPTERFFSNELIGEHDNSRLAYNLFNSLGKDAPILFDEYHNGFSERGETPFFSMWQALFSTPYGLFLLQIMLAAVVLLLNRDGLRTSPGRSAALSASPLEFAGAAAELYRRAGARSRAASDIIGILRIELARGMRLPHDCRLEDIRASLPDESEAAALIQKMIRFRDGIEDGAEISQKDSIEIARIAELIRKECLQKNYG